MARRQPLRSLGTAVLVAALIVPAVVVWLSGRFGQENERPLQTPTSAPLATLPRSETTAVPSSRPPPTPDVPPAPAPPVTVGPGAVTVPRPVPGAAPVPAPRAGEVVGEPQGIPDPNRSEATPR